MNRYSKGGGKNSKPPEQRGEPSPAENLTAPDTVLWDGTASKLVGDADAIFPEIHTGIQISYVLKEEEIYECLKKTRRVRANGRLYEAFFVAFSLVFAVLVAAGLVLQNSALFFWAVPFPVLMVLAAVLSERENKKRARKAADGHRISMQVYPDRIQVGSGKRQWKFPLDGTVRCARIGTMLALFAEGGKDSSLEKLILLPLRCVDPSVLPEVQAMIMAGTTPRRLSRR